jgi:hypothetical protein
MRCEFFTDDYDAKSTDVIALVLCIDDWNAPKDLARFV